VRTRWSAAILAVVVMVMVVFASACAGSGPDSDGSSPTTTTASTAAPAPTTTEVPLERGRQVFVYTPVVGDCFDKRTITTSNRPTEVTLKLDCPLPHQNEVFAVIPYVLPDPSNPAYPGRDVLRRFGKLECPKRYEAYVGRAYELSKYEIGYVDPAESTWTSDRSIGCYLYDSSDRLLVNSVRATGA
jgi:hypothetical protein